MEKLFDKDLESTIKNAFLKEITEKPPRIGLIGVSGVGKSSTINAMFKTDLEISHVKACTKEFKTVNLSVEINEGEATGNKALLQIIDAPGLGEDIALDPKYLEMYKDNLGKCDIILWVLTARNRAIALDQMYLKQLEEFGHKMVFGINQVDLIDPIDWNTKLNLPSKEQEANMNIILEDRKEKLEIIMGREISIIPYSAEHKYKLEELFAEMIITAPKERAWIFTSIKAFSPFDFVPEEIREQVINQVKKNDLYSNNEGQKGWLGNFFNK